MTATRMLEPDMESAASRVQPLHFVALLLTAFALAPPLAPPLVPPDFVASEKRGMPTMESLGVTRWRARRADGVFRGSLPVVEGGRRSACDPLSVLVLSVARVGEPRGIDRQWRLQVWPDWR